MLDRDNLEKIARIFIGDNDSVYKYKKGPEIYAFFNKYFNYNDKYWGTTQPSRWIIALNKLIEVANDGSINKYFSIILGLPYLHVENPELTNDELAELRSSIIELFNNILKSDALKIVVTSEKAKLLKIDEDLEFIGQGGFAEVYKVKSQNLILKKLKEENYINKGIVSRFKREFKITESLSDLKGVIKVYTFNEKELSYTMEPAEMDLYKYIMKNDLNYDQKIIIIHQILDVMKKVHERDIIHRDISPSNILLFNGLFKMSDFGLGKDLTIFNSHQTMNTNSYGQYFYCDPKQFMQLKEGDKSSDIYSIGKVINFVFTKNPNDSNHKLKGITEKATASSELARYKSIEEIEIAINTLQKFINSELYKKEIELKINHQIIDESVIDYINTLDSKKLFNYLQDFKFRKLYLKYLKDYNDSQQQYNSLNALYNEMQQWKDKKFEDYDSIGYLAIDLVKEKIDFSVKEAAIEMLNYIIDVNRFDVMREIKKMVNDGIEPLLEDKLYLSRLEDY